MGRLLLSGEVLALLLGLSFPANAVQEVMVVEDLAADEEGNLVGTWPPRTAFTEDGYLVIDGDMYLHCPSAVQIVEQYADNPPSGATVTVEVGQAREIARQCREVGYVGAGQYAGQTSPTARNGSTGAATALPETGGVALWLAGLDALAMAGGFLHCRMIR